MRCLDDEIDVFVAAQADRQFRANPRAYRTGGAMSSAIRRAAKPYSDIHSEPGRARLKQWHHAPPSPLSAHRFFGTLWRNYWCTHFHYNSAIHGVFRMQAFGAIP